MLTLIPVTDTIQMVQGRASGRFPYANAMLVRDGGVTALVDTGCGRAVLEALRAELRVDMVICSHSHVDHTSGNWLFPDCPIWMPAGIAFETGGEMRKLARRFIADETLHELWFATTIRQTGFRDAPLTDAYPPGHVFEIGRVRLHSIPAPGHVGDHTCFWDPASGALFAGDIDFSRFGPWYGNPESDVDAFEQSIREVQALRPRTVISSHKGVYQAALDAEFEAFAAHFGAREARILGALAAPVTLDDLVEQAHIYGRFPHAGDLLRYFERVMVEKHLQRLARQGRVRAHAPNLWQRV
ncbi:MAG: MBL fold metallo-hydrolase [Anaerolineae bacterium]|nr:MBL fold metallo-hydrolase [Anaerolineae bacterium]